MVISPNLTNYTCDQPVYLHAVPDIGQSFVRWEGASTSTEAEITLTMDANKEITAVFEPVPQEAFGIQIDLDEDGFLDTYTENNLPTAPEYMRVADYRDNGRLISVSPGDDDVQPIYSTSQDDWDAMYGLPNAYPAEWTADPTSFVGTAGETEVGFPGYLTIAMTRVELGRYIYPINRDLTNFGQRGCARQMYNHLRDSGISSLHLAQFDGGASVALVAPDPYGNQKIYNKGLRHYFLAVRAANKLLAMGFVNNYALFSVGGGSE